MAVGSTMSKRTYVVNHTEKEPPLIGQVEGTAWADANVIRLDRFQWGDDEDGPETTCRLCHDRSALWLQAQVEDDTISASVTERNGPTFRDSSIELFAAPTPTRDMRYLNFEVNCCGVFKLGWQRPGWREQSLGRKLIGDELAAEIEVVTSVDGPTKEPSPSDQEWWVAARLPFETLSAFTEREVFSGPSTSWRGNLYRSGVPDELKGTWSRIQLPEPEYHSPEHFGHFQFQTSR
ncbi:carbohydrate-binding family 9-like protein [Haloferax gibbonsii]|uniref:Carbohydrate-binding domain-containing protein n=1 Tax=Haloferax gibbonsii TaxID=35746 RepID=A0A0K1IZW7_HALGI|nr:carbohydrate-binding family 9-like protein [Haloferax gibbonsii]AKU09838.1 hypothetical protein ABY42_18650 [Haloferax gibbonsii]